ncbi:MAG: hypothetical protein AMXMBFR84_09280 [Candidatus Hydrogenedentota bacterium]
MAKALNQLTVTIAAVAALCVFPAPAIAQQAVFHGLPLNDGVNHLIIEQKYNVCRIGITSRERKWGPDFTANTGDVDQELPKTEVRYLAQVKAEVLKPSAPNYLQNPGYFYRITVESLDLFPPYSAKVEASADDVRDAVMYHVQRIAMETDDPKDATALWKASTLVLDIFKQSQLLPAEIYKSVLLSRSGLFRIIPNVRQRRKITPAQLFAPDMDIERPELGATMRQDEMERLPRLAAKPYGVGLPDPEQRFREFPFVQQPSKTDAFTSRYITQTEAARNPVYRTGDKGSSGSR